MPSTCRHSYDLNFKLKIVAEAEAVNNNREIAREYGISEFELPATRTLEFTGSRTVPVLSCGADKQSFTVALTVKANGEKLPPRVIFKGVRQLNINTPPRMQISVHKKGWMDEEGMFYLHTAYSEKELFERATNTILGIRNCIVVMDIMLLSTCC